MRILTMAAALGVAAFAVPADAIELGMPIDCTFGVDCMIQNYVDAEPDDGTADFTCGPLTYDGHQGTDFRLLNRSEIRKGFDALATAPGRVASMIDNRPDHGFTNAEENPLGCGNAVMIDHGKGWVSQYCHLAQGSIPVRVGDTVETGQPLGKIGSSGGTSFPHLHYAIRRFGVTINPFTGVSPTGCKAPKAAPLWKAETGLDYVPTTLFGFGVTGTFPSLETVQADHDALVEPSGETAPVFVWLHMLGARKGDSLRLIAFDPSDRAFASEVFPVDQDQTIFLANIGLTPEDLRLETWPEGTYTARAILYDGSDEVMRETVEFSLP